MKTTFVNHNSFCSRYAFFVTHVKVIDIVIRGSNFCLSHCLVLLCSLIWCYINLCPQSIKAREQQQQSQQQIQMQQLLLQRHVQQQQQHPQEQEQQRRQQKQQHRSENTDFTTNVQNGTAAADSLVRQNDTAANALSAKIYDDRMKSTVQREISEEALMKVIFSTAIIHCFFNTC